MRNHADKMKGDVGRAVLSHRECPAFGAQLGGGKATVVAVGRRISNGEVVCKLGCHIGLQGQTGVCVETRGLSKGCG
jgi:hypothetical protein